MKKHTRATPAGTPRGRSPLTRRERAVIPSADHAYPKGYAKRVARWALNEIAVDRRRGRWLPDPTHAKPPRARGGSPAYQAAVERRACRIAQVASYLFHLDWAIRKTTPAAINPDHVLRPYIEVAPHPDHYNPPTFRGTPMPMFMIPNEHLLVFHRPPPLECGVLRFQTA